MKSLKKWKVINRFSGEEVGRYMFEKAAIDNALAMNMYANLSGAKTNPFAVSNIDDRNS